MRSFKLQAAKAYTRFPISEEVPQDTYGSIVVESIDGNGPANFPGVVVVNSVIKPNQYVLPFVGK